jgi:hypothetical protein
MLFIPPRIVITRKCRRCKLRYPRKEAHCPHCHHLSDNEVEALKARHKAEQKGNARLGKLFLYIALLIALGMVISYINI